MAEAKSNRIASWRIILAFILDLAMCFWIFGYLIAVVTGNTTDGGFSLEGGPALISFALIIAYFVVFNRYLGGTIWQRVLGAVRK